MEQTTAGVSFFFQWWIVRHTSLGIEYPIERAIVAASESAGHRSVWNSGRELRNASVELWKTMRPSIFFCTPTMTPIQPLFYCSIFRIWISWINLQPSLQKKKITSTNAKNPSPSKKKTKEESENIKNTKRTSGRPTGIAILQFKINAVVTKELNILNLGECFQNAKSMKKYSLTSE